mmetsp:Transcript_13088/g.23139  ORF Transcript_13088/g.23139 Transcript_13088/m.23139 type:complete len:204 (-) Transcript_13088:337-948(-)
MQMGTARFDLSLADALGLPVESVLELTVGEAVFESPAEAAEFELPLEAVLELLAGSVFELPVRSALELTVGAACGLLTSLAVLELPLTEAVELSAGAVLELAAIEAFELSAGDVAEGGCSAGLGLPAMALAPSKTTTEEAVAFAEPDVLKSSTGLIRSSNWKLRGFSWVLAAAVIPSSSSSSAISSSSISYAGNTKLSSFPSV